MAEPMIAVKKADGTIVRMPLSEVKKMQTAGPTNTVVTTSEPVVAQPDFKIPVPEDALVVNGKIPVSTGNVLADVKKLLSVPELEPTPVEPLLPDHFTEEQIIPVAKPHSPLSLQEPADQEIKQESVLGTASYDDVVARVLREAKITPPPDLQARYQSLIMSAAKGVRTVEQILRYAVMDNVQGGLGLSSEVAERLGKALAQIPGIQVPISPIKRATPVATAMQAQLAPVTPVVPLSVRPTMHDVEAPKNRPVVASAATIMGPVDEMQNFSLLDWRRLAVTPEKAAEIVMRKFAVWKEESFYLYQDTRAAWLSSPLIREYQTTLAKAINQNTRLSGLSMSGEAKNTITAGDIAALVAVNRSLAV